MYLPPEFEDCAGLGRWDVDKFVSEVVAFDDGIVSGFSPTSTVQAFEL